MAHIGEGKPVPCEKHNGCGACNIAIPGLCLNRGPVPTFRPRKLFFGWGSWIGENFVGADDLAVESAGN